MNYEDALKSNLSNRQIARDFHKNESTVRRNRKAMGHKSPFAEAEAASGESETHNSDGSSSYVRFSERPWGKSDHDGFLREQGVDPGTVTYTWGWTSNPAGGFWNKLNNVRPINSTGNETYELRHLYEAVDILSRAVGTDTPENTSKRATVVCLADWQLGKTGRRGGTKETLQRLEYTRQALKTIYTERAPGTILLFDLGDGIEGFESGGDPQFTNDLSLPDQLDAYSTELFKFVAQANFFAKTEVAAVPSNHASWRRGKQQLGKPTDDFGLYVHREVAKVSNAAGYGVTWHSPDPYDESVAVTLFGTVVGGVHGNQFAPGKAIDWWQSQAFGSQAITKADVCVTGHYHSFGAAVAGINPFSGRERMWLGAPTVDPGSDWYRAIRGRDSLPGTLIFDVTEDGFDLGSLTII